jgi:phospholipase C
VAPCAVGDLTSAFRFGQPEYNPPKLPDTNGQYNLSQYEINQYPLPTWPTTNQQMPRQEPGRRPSVP